MKFPAVTSESMIFSKRWNALDMFSRSLGGYTVYVCPSTPGCCLVTTSNLVFLEFRYIIPTYTGTPREHPGKKLKRNAQRSFLLVGDVFFFAFGGGG